MIEACLFDLDGVIVDTARYHFLAWRRLAGTLARAHLVIGSLAEFDLEVLRNGTLCEAGRVADRRG